MILEKPVSFVRLLTALYFIVFAATAHAATMKFTFTEVGGDVVLEAEGAFNTSAGSAFVSVLPSGSTTVGASDGLIQLFPASTTGTTLYQVNLPNLSFGSGGFFGSLPSGTDTFGFCTFTACPFTTAGALYVPTNYVSGTIVSNTAIFIGESIQSLGLFEGQTVYDYGTGDQIIVETIGPSVVPLPTTLPLLAACLGLFGVLRCRRKAT